MKHRPPPPSAVLESALYAENLEETARFYEAVLGLERFAERDGRHVFFRCGAAVFLLFHPAATDDPSSELPRHGARGAGHLAFAIREDEVGSWRARLQASGVEIEREVNWPGGGESLYFRDPAGNSVELATPALWSIDETTIF